MAGRCKVFFDLGLLVCLWVEVSSRPEGLPSPVMLADKTDSDPSRVIDTFADTHSLADALHFDSSRTIYTSDDALADMDPDSSRALDSPTDRDSPADEINHDFSIAMDPFNDRETPADNLNPDSSITIHSSTDTDTPEEELIPDSSINIDSSSDIVSHADLPHMDSPIAKDKFAEKDTSDHVGPSAGSVMEQNDIRKVLIEEFKKRILDGLKLANAPTETLNGTEFSNDLMEVLQQENEVTRSDQKENIIVHASNRDRSCLRSNGTHCLRFEFNITSDLDSVISVHAWFHKPRLSERLLVRTYSSSSDEDEPLVRLKEAPLRTTGNSSGWTSIELPKTLTLESRGEYLTGTVEIEGAAVDTDKEYIPFLVITKHTESQESKKRAKRSSSESCTCCAEDFYVTLEEIGWQNWVHRPKKFNIRMCRGQCSENLSSYTIKYEQIISSYYKIKNYPKPKCYFWAPRCEPDSYSPLRIMYKQQDDSQEEGALLHDQVIKDVVIESCRCM